MAPNPTSPICFSLICFSFPTVDSAVPIRVGFAQTMPDSTDPALATSALTPLAEDRVQAADTSCIGGFARARVPLPYWLRGGDCVPIRPRQFGVQKGPGLPT